MPYFQLVLIKNTKSMHSIQLLFGYLFIFNVLFFMFDSIFFIFDIIFFYSIFDFLFFFTFDVLFFFIFDPLIFVVFNSLFLIFNVQWNLIMDEKILYNKKVYVRIDISMSKLSYLYGARPEHGLKHLCTDWFNCVYFLAICIEQG